MFSRLGEGAFYPKQLTLIFLLVICNSSPLSQLICEFALAHLCSIRSFMVALKNNCDRAHNAFNPTPLMMDSPTLAMHRAEETFLNVQLKHCATEEDCMSGDAGSTTKER